jgi:AraC family transcriptional regulator, transcriptional activator FtrA
MYVDDGQILSSGGMLASADLCLYLLSQDHGQPTPTMCHGYS